MKKEGLIGMATATALLAGCSENQINGASTVNCKQGPTEASSTLQLPANERVSISDTAVISLGNGRADIRLRGVIVFGENPEITKEPDTGEAIIIGKNSVKFRPGRPVGAPIQPVNILNVEQGEGGKTKITATFKCDQVSIEK